MSSSGSSPKHVRVAIIGAGPAGLTAALYCARAMLAPVVFSGVSVPSQISVTTSVENFPSFPDGISGPAILERLEEQASKYGADILWDDVQRLELTRRPFRIFYGVTEPHSVLLADSIILAMGASARRLEVPGTEKYWGRDISSCAVCDSHFARDRDVIVVGGGDAAAEEALYLTRFARSVTLIHRRRELRASQILQRRLFESPVRIVWNQNVKEMRGGEHLETVVMKDADDGAVTTIEAGALFFAIGHDPSTSLLRTTPLELTEDGYVVHTNQPTTETSIPGVFAAGDVADRLYRQAVCAAGQGAAAAIDAERWLTRNEG